MTLWRLDDAQPHAFWDNSLEPRARIAPGDTVIFETLEGTGQVTPATGSGALASLRPGLIHPLNGPVVVEGATPGDGLVVEVVALEHKGWGWNGVIPGFGLLGGEFGEPYIHHYRLAGDECFFADDVVIPIEPFCGVMGVAPAEPGRISTAPPRRNGGNLDLRHLTPGARLVLPVLVEGALFSCGDCHAAQGDGEVNGTGVESPMSVTLRFHLRRRGAPATTEFFTRPGPLSRSERSGYLATTAHGPDLMEDARGAVRSMIDHLVAERGLSREQAYCLCGAAVDLRLSQVVNEPNWLVSAYLPLSIFR
jgi:acetamidase/formamidase